MSLSRREVFVGGKKIPFTKTEFALLQHLMTHPGQLHTHDMLLREVWGPGYEGEHPYVRIHICKVRTKVEPDREHLAPSWGAAGLGTCSTTSTSPLTLRLSGLRE